MLLNCYVKDYYDLILLNAIFTSLMIQFQNVRVTCHMNGVVMSCVNSSTFANIKVKLGYIIVRSKA